MATKSRPIYNNFNAGEISPLMAGRVDYPRFQNGVEKLENWILHVQGGVTRRWGTKYIGEVKDSSRRTRLIPLEFASDATILVELGHEYIRFWKNDSLVYEPTSELITNGTFDSDISGWTDPAWPLSASPTWNSSLKALQLNGFVGTPPNDDGKSAAYQAIATTIGKTYRISWTGDNVVHGVYVGTTAGGYEIGYKIGTIGSNSYEFVATATTTYITFLSIYNVTNIDDISLIDITGSILEIATTYQEEDLFELQYVQSNDVIYFVHQNYPVKKLSRLATTSDEWDFGSVVFLPPPSYEKEKMLSDTLAFSAITGTGVICYAGTAYFLAADVDSVITHDIGRAVITAVDASGDFCTVDLLDDLTADHIVAGLGTISGAATTITTSVPHGLTAANIGDVIISTSGVTSGQVRRIDGVPAADQLTINAAFSANPAGASWNQGVHVAGMDFKILGSPSTKLTSDKTGPVRAIATLTLDDDGWRSDDVGKYVKAMGGLLKITAFTSATVVSAQILNPLSSAPTSAPYETLAGTWTLEEEAWTSDNGYPSAVCFYEQRLFFGGTILKPQTIWGSVTDDYENFATGAQASDSVEFTIASNDLNPIRWLASGRILLIGTSRREFRASGGADPISPSNVDIRPETPYGSPKRRPENIGHTTMFVQRAKRKIREMAYNYDSDAYHGTDLTVIAPHISEGGIEDIAYCQEPYSILYAIRGDGQLLALAYEKDQDVFGWGRIITDGLFETIGILPPVTGSDEYRVYFVVNRTVNGATRRYIERFDSSLHTDCAIVGSSSSAIITGIDHLEGKIVKMKGDGALYDDDTVVGGTVQFSEVVGSYEIGLPYISELVTHRPELATQKGSIQGQPKAWSQLIVRVLETIGLKVNGDPIWGRDTLDLMGDAPLPKTGDFPVTPIGIDIDGKITIVQDQPFPATVLLVAGELDVGD